MTDLYSQNRMAYSSVLENAAKTSAGWRLCTLIALLISLCAVAGVVYIGAQTRIRPVLVVMDESYIPVGLYQPGAGLAVNDERVTKASLAQFVSTWRIVSIDATFQKQRVNDLAKFIDNNSPAFAKLRDYIVSDASNPLKRAIFETVSIRISNVLPVSPMTWQVDWVETVTQRSNGQAVSKRWQANITFAFMDDVPAEILLTNPTGLLVSDINWAESI